MNKVKNFLKLKLRLLATFFTAAFFAGAFAFIVYHLAYADKVIPGIKVDDLNIGGMTSEELKSALTKRFSAGNVKVTMSYQGKSFEISDKDLSLSYRLDTTSSKIMKLGRSGDFIVDTKDKLAALFKGIKVKPDYKLDSGKLNQELSAIEGLVNVQSQDPGIVLENGELVVTKAVTGKVLQTSAVRIVVFSAIDNGESLKAELPVKDIQPENTEQELALLKDQVAKIIGTSPLVVFQEKKWIYSKQDLLALLAYKKDSKGKVVISADKIKVLKIAHDLASVTNVEPRGEVTKTNADRVLDFKVKTTGKTLDAEKFRKDFSQALLGDSKKVELQMVATTAPEGVKNYGIYALLGEGVSYFHDSIPNRIHNLTLASERASGILIAPGETFSFNKSVGKVDNTTGYKPAYVIENGRTVLGDGGGVCQASTTFFRAALNAGLPIIKRTAHAYRVHYYEEKAELGQDATVYAPSVDLQFKNDTPGYILIQADWDLAEYMLRVKIYGTPDGRTVEVSKTTILSQTPPPPALYQDDPTLPKGVVKQVDWAAWGANAYFTRVVKKDGKEIINDKFVSNYRPWQAIYLRGTK